MCLRMGEDTQTTISLSLDSLFIFLILFTPSFPSVGAHQSPISQHASFSFNYSSALFVPPSRTYSISSLGSPFRLHAGRLQCYPITLTMQDAARVRCVFVHICTFVSFWGTGATTWHSSNLLPTRDGTTEGAAGEKQNEIQFLWNMAVTGAEIT